MKLGTIRADGKETVIGRVDDDHGVALAPATMEALIAGGDAALADAQKVIDSAVAGSAKLIELAGADWLAPNPRASKIIGCAVNNNHLNKVAYRPMKSPMYFMKGRSALTGHNKPIKILKRHGRTIPEPEPVAVFKSIAKDVEPENILDHVFGYTVTNDCTAGGIKFGEDSIALNQRPDLIFPHHMEWRHRFEDDNYIYFIYHSRSKAADTFAAMTTNRPYQKAMSLEYVSEKMKAMAGTRFDPTVVEAFAAAVDAGDIMPPEPVQSGEMIDAGQEVS